MCTHVHVFGKLKSLSCNNLLRKLYISVLNTVHIFFPKKFCFYQNPQDFSPLQHMNTLIMWFQKWDLHTCK